MSGDCSVTRAVAIEQCLEKIDCGQSERKACAELGIPRSTMQRHRKALSQNRPLPHPGNPPNLPPQLSIEIAGIAKTAAENGFGISKKELISFVGDVVKNECNSDSAVAVYLRKYCRFVNKIPSEEWAERFMKKNHLSLVKPSPLERSRVISAADPTIINHFYALLHREMERMEIINKPSHIYNVDETSFCIDPSRGKVVAGIGNGSTHRITSGPARQSFSTMACICADGTVQPPLIIFKGKHLYDSWKGHNVIDGVMYAKSENGWMTKEIFTSWFAKFIERVTERPLLLLFDGHSTHLGMEIIQLARQSDVCILKLPSHTSNLLQPLDVACFHPLKQAWDEGLVSHQRKNGFASISKSVFVDILSSIWNEKLNASNIRSGFLKTGIFPLDPNKFPRQFFHQAKLMAYETKHSSLVQQSTLFLDATPTDSTPEGSVLEPGAASSVMNSSHFRNAVFLLSQQMQAFLSKTSDSNQTQSQETEQDLRTILNDTFISKFSPLRLKNSDGAAKRKRIQQSAAVITHDEYLEAIHSMKAKPQRPKKSRLLQCPKLKKTDLMSAFSTTSDDDDSIPRLPPPLTTMINKMHRNGKPQVGDFVLFKASQASSSSTRSLRSAFFVGLILGKCKVSDSWKIKAMKRVAGTRSGSHFVNHSQPAGIEMCQAEDIIFVLTQPKIDHDDVHYFTDDFTVYLSRLQ
jgi:hypothetical protein